MSKEGNREAKRKHVYIWKVENLSMCSKKKGEKLISPTFKAKSFDETSWLLELYPLGVEESDDGYISMFLIRGGDDTFPFAIECDFIIELINKNGYSVMCSKYTQKFEKGSSWGWRNYIKTVDLLKTAVFNDTLIIRCTLSGNMPEKNFYSQNSSISKFKVCSYSFHWVVKNLDSDNPQERLKFECSKSSHLEITIQIPEDDVKISLRMDKNFSRSHFISSNIVLLDIEGKQRDPKRATHFFENTERWEFPAFITKTKLNAERDVYIKDGCFTLKCDISLSDGTIVEDTEKNVDVLVVDKFAIAATDNFSVLKEDIKRMYENKIYSDIKLNAGTEVFPAHKSILCARSPVFSSMFNQGHA